MRMTSRQQLTSVAGLDAGFGSIAAGRLDAEAVLPLLELKAQGLVHVHLHRQQASQRPI